LVLVGSARSTDGSQFELFGIDMAATGESVKIDVSIQCWEEGTHAYQAAWDIVGTGQRTSAGVSSRTSTSGGGGSGQTANTFTAPNKPSVAVSNPASAVSPNTAHRLAILGTGKPGVDILWQWTATIKRGKVA
jgi:hypothetical protein